MKVALHLTIYYLYFVQEINLNSNFKAKATSIYPGGKHSYQYIRVTASQEEIDGSTDR